MRNVSFIVCVERGILARKTILLVESIRRNGGSLKDSPILAIQPRQSKPLTSKKVKKLSEMNVSYIYANMNKKWRRYNFINKIYASALGEEYFEGKTQNVVFIDSDTLVIKEPKCLRVPRGKKVSISPIDVKANGTGVNEKISDFWSYMYDVAGVNKKSIWNTKTRVDNEKVYAYFQAGVVSVRPENKILRSWKDNLQCIDKKLFESKYKSQKMFLERALLSATILSETNKSEVQLLPLRCNYPYHKRHKVDNKRNISIIHYHNELDANKLSRKFCEQEKSEWINKNLPLRGKMEVLIQKIKGRLSMT